MASPRVTTSLSEDVTLYLEGAIEAGVYVNTGDGIRSAVRSYFADHPEEATACAIELYVHEEVDLLTAARLANQTPGEFRERLTELDALRSDDV